MNNTIISKFSLVLVIFMIFSLASCELFASADSEETAKTPWDSAVYKEDTELGAGSKTVEVQVVVNDNSVTFTIHTDAQTLGQALLELGIIEGEDSAYGLYIKKVNGITADYDIDGSYWGFYQNGEYAMSGVDSTNISGGEHFELVYTK